MRVLLPLEKEHSEVSGIKTVRQLLSHFSFKEEEVLVVNKKDSKLLTSDDRLEDEMEIGIIRVVSGG